MTSILAILTAILPACVLLFYIYKKDALQPEPVGQMMKAFGYGCFSCLIAIIIEIPVSYLISFIQIPVFQEILDAFFVAAVPEEGVKLLCLYLFFKQCHFFDEYFDGIVYAVCVGLGFATIENIGYVLGAEEWVHVGIVRALISVPGHYAFAVIMGFYYSLMHFRGFKSRFYKALVFVAPVIFHGIFDALLMISSVPIGPASLLMIVFFYFNYKTHKLCSAKIRAHIQRDIDENTINNKL